MSEKRAFVYVSSWNQFGGEPGLGLYYLDTDSGELEFAGMQNVELSCGFSCVDRRRSVLYLVNETGKLPGTSMGGGGRVFAFRVDPSSGRLTELCNVPTYCPNPCYLSLDATGDYLVVANHSGNGVVTKVDRDALGKFRLSVERDDAVVNLFSVAPDGSIGELLDVVKHGAPDFPRGPVHAHPHTALMSPSGKLFAVCDKGEDRIYMYEIDRAKGRLSPCSKPHDEVLGSSPRYCLFHPKLPYFYVNHEKSAEGMNVECFRYDESGGLELLRSVEVMQEGYVKGGHDEQQGFCMHPSGRYAYDVVNGPNVVVVLKVDERSGSLEPIQRQEVQGAWPRGCALSPDGKFLIVACLKSGDLLVFAVGEDGKLTPLGSRAKQASASYVTIYRP